LSKVVTRSRKNLALVLTAVITQSQSVESILTAVHTPQALGEETVKRRKKERECLTEKVQWLKFVLRFCLL